MMDWNGNGKRDSFDLFMDLQLIDSWRKKDSSGSSGNSGGNGGGSGCLATIVAIIVVLMILSFVGNMIKPDEKKDDYDYSYHTNVDTASPSSGYSKNSNDSYGTNETSDPTTTPYVYHPNAGSGNRNSYSSSGSDDNSHYNEDGYDMSDYSGADDFYEDNEDDFDGYEDAEDYYEENGEE